MDHGESAETYGNESNSWTNDTCALPHQWTCRRRTKIIESQIKHDNVTRIAEIQWNNDYVQKHKAKPLTNIVGTASKRHSKQQWNSIGNTVGTELETASQAAWNVDFCSIRSTSSTQATAAVAAATTTHHRYHRGATGGGIAAEFPRKFPRTFS